RRLITLSAALCDLNIPPKASEFDDIITLSSPKVVNSRGLFDLGVTEESSSLERVVVTASFTLWGVFLPTNHLRRWRSWCRIPFAEAYFLLGRIPRSTEP